MPKLAAAYIAIAFGSGILAAEYAPLWLCVVVSGVAVVAAAAPVRKQSRVGLAIVASAFLLGAWRYDVGRRVPPDDISQYVGAATAMQGSVASDPEGAEGRARFAFRVDRARLAEGWRNTSGRVMVSVYSDGYASGQKASRSIGAGGDASGRLPRSIAAMPRLEYGSRATISTALYRPLDPSNPGRFSWRGYLQRNGIYACATVRSASQVELLPTSAGNPVVGLALGARHGLADSISRLHPREEASVIVGMVLGTYAYLPPSTLRSFSRTGTLHLLAASGFNCYVLLFLTAPLLRLIRVFPKWRGAAIIAAILLYVLMAGAKPSLVRAAIMSSLVLLARPLRRVPNTTGLFFIAGLIILAIDPGDLFDVGFQLSFLAVWAIIYVSPIIGASSVLNWAGLVVRDPAVRPKRRHLVLRKFAGALAATAIATTAVTLVTAPVVAYYFNYVSLASVPANMAVELGVPVVFAVGFLSPIAAHVGWLGTAVGWIGTETTRAMLAVVNELGGMRWSAVSVASPGPLAMLGYYVILHAALGYVRSRNAA